MWKHWVGKGVSNFRTAGLDTDIPFVRCAKEVGYQQRLVALLAGWWGDKNVSTVPEVAFSCLDKDWSQIKLVVEHHYWTCKHYYETRLCIQHKFLTVCNNVEIFLWILLVAMVYIHYYRLDERNMSLLSSVCFYSRTFSPISASCISMVVLRIHGEWLRWQLSSSSSWRLCRSYFMLLSKVRWTILLDRYALTMLGAECCFGFCPLRLTC